MFASDNSQSLNAPLSHDASYDIGILALQGNFVQHREVLLTLNKQFPHLKTYFIKTLSDLSSRRYSAIVIPGGESTTMSYLLDKQNMRAPLKTLMQEKLPILGTCAGLILLSSHITNQEDTPPPMPLGMMHITVERNGYGKQLDSFIAEVDFTPNQQHAISDVTRIRGMFIRAPKIIDAGMQGKVLARYQGEPVIVQEDNILVSTFHPEAVGETTFHRYFIEEIVIPSNDKK